MIAWDTNVLVRYLITDDDPEQSALALKSARQESRKGERIFISTVTLCETAWVLRSAYKLNRKSLRVAFDALRQDPCFAFEESGLFAEALDLYRDNKGDFSDYLIGLAAKRKAGAAATLTFDKALRGSALFRVSEP